MFENLYVYDNMFSIAGKKICFQLSLLLQNVLRETVFSVSIFDFCLKNRDAISIIKYFSPL